MPARVGVTPRASRSKSLVPICFSSRATCWDTAGWVNVRASAAAENEPRAATSRKVSRRRRSSIVRGPYHAPLIDVMRDRSLTLYVLRGTM